MGRPTSITALAGQPEGLAEWRVQRGALSRVAKAKRQAASKEDAAGAQFPRVARRGPCREQRSMSPAARQPTRAVRGGRRAVAVDSDSDDHYDRFLLLSKRARHAANRGRPGPGRLQHRPQHAPHQLPCACPPLSAVHLQSPALPRTLPCRSPHISHPAGRSGGRATADAALVAMTAATAAVDKKGVEPDEIRRRALRCTRRGVACEYSYEEGARGPHRRP